MTENKMVGWQHQINGHVFGQALGVGDGQGSLVWCSPWGCKELDTTEQLNSTEVLRAVTGFCILTLSSMDDFEFHVFSQFLREGLFCLKSSPPQVY